MSHPIHLDGASLTVDQVVAVARHPSTTVVADPDALAALGQSRARVEHAIERGETIYGINTGFGKLAHVRIPTEQLEQLQVNLIRSHAAGVGDLLAPSVPSDGATGILRARRSRDRRLCGDDGSQTWGGHRGT